MTDEKRLEDDSAAGYISSCDSLEQEKHAKTAPAGRGRLFRRPRHRLRVSIQTQLISLVLFVALFSLLTLAIVTGCYFSTNTKSTNASKLVVEAQLKASQMSQGFNYYYYQASLLTAKDSIQTALAYAKAGNSTNSSIKEAHDTIQAFLDTSTIFNGARLYDLDFGLLINVTGSIPLNVTDEDFANLFVLDLTDPLHPPDGLSSDGAFVWGPDRISSDYFGSYTVAVDTNSTLLIQEKALGGYLTLIMNLTMIDYTDDSTSSSSESSRFYRPVTPLDDRSNISGFTYVFQPDADTPITKEYALDSYKPVQMILNGEYATYYDINVKDPLQKKVAAGASTVDFKYGTWAVTVEQDESAFNEPMEKLIKLMVGVCIGLSCFMCIFTFVISHYGVRPILKLQKATEAITEGRGLRSSKKPHKKKKSSSRSKSILFDRKPRTPSPSPTGGDNSNVMVAHLQPPDPQSNTDQSRYSHTRNISMNSNNSHISGTPSSGYAPSQEGSSYDDDQRNYMPGSFPDTETSTNNGYTESIVSLPAIVPTRGIFYDELTELTEAFNAMTAELDKQYAHLEDRVRARTRQLQVAKVQADAARKQAEDANEAKTVFIANISHELRTPLNGILGMTSVAMAEKDTDKIQSSLELIFRSGELLLHILTQLLTFSKNQLDKSKLQRKNFIIKEVATQIKTIFGKAAKDQHVNLIISIKPNFMRKMILLGDSNRIIQVVMNLVSNSLKFTPEDGTVKVVMKVLGEYDEERSENVNYGSAYVKGLDEPPESVPPYHPQTLKSTALTPVSSNSTLVTMQSSLYHKEIAEAYNFGQSERDLFDEGEDMFLDDDTDGAIDTEEVQRARECYRFKESQKKWVVRFSVSDTGTGIDESLQGKIFEAFVQGDQTLSRSHGGTGLGLSICKQFAKMMHGSLTLTSKVGEGSTFTFIIPLPQIGELVVCEDDKSFYDDEFNEVFAKNKKVTFVEEIPSEASSDTHMRSPDSYETNSGEFEKPELFTAGSTGTAKARERGNSISDVSFGSIESPPSVEGPHKRFLVAEDNLVNQEVVKRMLKLEGYTDVTLACNGVEAINSVKEANERGETFDLILMDVQMPTMDGITATTILRKDMSYDGPIVALTAFADKLNENVCSNAGMSGFLSKPVRRNLLRVIIKTYCPDPVPSQSPKSPGEKFDSTKEESETEEADTKSETKGPETKETPDDKPGKTVQ